MSGEARILNDAVFERERYLDVISAKGILGLGL